MLRLLPAVLLAACLQAASSHAETFRLFDGGEIKGSLVSSEPDHYVVAQGSATVKVPRSSVAAVQPDVYYLLMNDGAVLSGSVKDISAGFITLETAKGAREIDRAAVIKLSTSPINVPIGAPAVSTATAQGYSSPVSTAAVPAAAAAVPAAASSVAPVAVAQPAAAAPAPHPAPQQLPAPKPTLETPAAQNFHYDVAEQGFKKADEPPPQTTQTPAEAQPARSENAAQGQQKYKPWQLSLQLGIWKPGVKLTDPSFGNETISADKIGIALGGRLMRRIGKSDWLAGADLSLLSMSSKDYGTATANVKVSGERTNMLALAARKTVSLGEYDLYAIGGLGTSKIKVNYNVTPLPTIANPNPASNGYSVSESKLMLAGGLELQGKIGTALAGLDLMFYKAGTGSATLGGTASLTFSLGARLIWQF